MNDKAVYKTALAAPGLLKIVKYKYPFLNIGIVTTLGIK